MILAQFCFTFLASHEFILKGDRKKMSFKSGFVAIVGRPNVGKSTLLNQILKQKVSIISDKVQTTRRRIRGIYTDKRGQIIFVDTPGIHKPLFELGKYLMEEAKLSIPDADVILFLVDGHEPPGSGDKWIVENLLQSEKPVIMIINKIDTIKDLAVREENVEQYKKLFDKQKVPCLQVSAKTGRNVEDLIKNILRALPKGPKYFPDDDVTDQSMRSIVEEMIREKVLLATSEEIPHSIAVQIEEYKDEPTISKIRATIYVERESQKGMVVGKNGDMVKQIGSNARKDIETMIGKQAFIDLKVKVKKDWRKSPSALKQFGYEIQKD